MNSPLKTYSLVNSLRESIFREDLCLYNWLQGAPVQGEGDRADPRRGGHVRQPPLVLRRPAQADRARARRRRQVRGVHGVAGPRMPQAGGQGGNSIEKKNRLEFWFEKPLEIPF